VAEDPDLVARPRTHGPQVDQLLELRAHGLLDGDGLLEDLLLVGSLDGRGHRHDRALGRVVLLGGAADGDVEGHAPILPQIGRFDR
jgi:hypothetical protein